MDILEILKYFIYFQLPVLFKALIIWMINGKAAAQEYRRKCFAEMMIEFSIGYNLKTKDIKTKLFEDLALIQSKDPSLRNQGKIRILEVGIGSGTNLQYFPTNCNVIGVDHNASFEKVVRNNMKSHPQMTLEDFLVISASNMANVPSGSVDVVVTTLVLCSIDHLNGVLKEIHRVLAPGGRHYYLEHILEEPNTLLNIVQRLLTRLRIWPFLFDGCCFQSIDKILKQKSIFPSVEQKIVQIDTSGFWAFEFLHTHVSGVQIK